MRGVASSDRLYETAAKLFHTNGYGATTTREIAAAIGVQQASLYHHVANKEDLLYRVCQTSLQPFLTEVPVEVLSEESVVERLPILVRAHLVRLLRYQERNVTQLMELKSLSGRRRAEILEMRGHYERFLRGVLENLQSKRVVRDDIPAKFLGLALMSMLNHTAMWFRPGKGETPEELARILHSVFFRGAVAGSYRSAASLRELFEQPQQSPKRQRILRGAKPSFARALDAAVALFSKKGYTATSTREVATLLGIQKASLYYHVESKEDLLFMVCKSSLNQITSDTGEAIAGVENPLERMEVLIRTHIESLLRDAAWHSTSFAEWSQLSPERRKEVLALRDNYEKMLRETIVSCQTAGVLRQDIDAKHLCLALLGLMNHVRVWFRRSGPLSPTQIGILFGALFLQGAGHSEPRTQ